MTTAAAAAGSGWTVTGQRQTQEIPPGQVGFTQGVEVTFVTGHNVVGKVFVPLAGFTPDKVAAAISARAAQLDAVSGLSAPAGG